MNNNVPSDATVIKKLRQAESYAAKAEMLLCDIAIKEADAHKLACALHRHLMERIREARREIDDNKTTRISRWKE